MKFTDTHCHLFSQYYDDIDNILKVSDEFGVNSVINNSCDRLSIIEVLKLSSKYENMYAAIGIHPEAVDSYTEEDMQLMREHLNDEKVVAIGEIGLDYHYTKENRNEQIKLFERQLKMAEVVNKPVIIHSRDATQDVIDILQKYNLKGVIHSFSGSLEVAKIFIKMGYVLGISGVITFKNCNLKEIVKEIDLEHIILETDAPYLAPVPYRGKKNIPGYVVSTAQFVADIKNVTLDELAIITNANIRRIFDK